jgi:hypothetical protein
MTPLKLAFDEWLDPTALWRSSEIIRNKYPDTADALAEYAGTLADILDLPEVES